MKIKNKNYKKIIILPHADDEMFIINRILQLKKIDILMIVITSTNKRSKETSNLLIKNKLNNIDLLILRDYEYFPDGELYLYSKKLYLLFEKILKKINFKGDIWVTAWEGGHHDHDISYAIIKKLLQTKFKNRHINLYEFYCYRAHKYLDRLVVVSTPFSNECSNYISPSYFQRLNNLRNVLFYKSQFKTWLGLAPLLLIKYLLSKKIEFLIQKNLFDTFKRPHKEKLFYEKRFKVSFDLVYNAILKL